MLEALNQGLKHNALPRFIIGNDAPSGTGVVPLGILRVICMAASLTDVRAEQALCMATGNTARVFGLNTGFVREGSGRGPGSNGCSYGLDRRGRVTGHRGRRRARSFHGDDRRQDRSESQPKYPTGSEKSQGGLMRACLSAKRIGYTHAGNH